MTVPHDPLLARPRRTGSASARAAESDLVGEVEAPTTRPAGRGRRARRTMWPATAAVVSLGVVFVTLFPVRAHLDQRADIRRADAELDELRATNAGLDARVAALGTDEEIERAARAQLNMVRAGEEAFALLPPQFPAELPDAFPYGLARQLLQPPR